METQEYKAPVNNGFNTQGSSDVDQNADLGRVETPQIVVEEKPLEATPLRSSLEIATEKPRGENLSERQKRNIELMKGLEKRFPNAFGDKIVDDKGRETLVFNSDMNPLEYRRMISQEGFFELDVNRNGGWEVFKGCFDWTALGDGLETIKVHDDRFELPLNDEMLTGAGRAQFGQSRVLYGEFFSLENQGIIDFLGRYVINKEKEGAEEKRRREHPEPPVRSASDILEGIF